MNETVEYTYTGKTLLLALFTFLLGWCSYSLWHTTWEVLWIINVLTSVTFAFYAITLICVPFSDKILRMTETELQVPSGWPIKKTIEVPFAEIKKLQLKKTPNRRCLIVGHDYKTIFIPERMLPNSEAFDRVSKILLDAVKQHAGKAAIVISSEKEIQGRI
jgi:hypothetical protein